MILTVIVIVIVSLLEHTYAVPCIGLRISTCACTGTKVYCSSKGLTAIPEGVPINTTELILYGNTISSLQDGVFSKNINLKTVNLQNNRISIIPVNAFEDLVSLESLNLNANIISSLPDGVFSKNINLRTVNLGYNRISIIPVNAFEDLVLLEILILNGNRISSLPDGVFSKNINLKTVILGRNMISIIPVNAFEDLVLLEYLGLGTNTISSLPGGLISKNINLGEIDLSRNSLSSVPEGFFSSNINLLTIHLTDNAFTTVSANIFMAMTNVEVLDLSRNQLLCCKMTDLFEWAAIQTNAPLSGDCTDFGIVTNIEEFDISNCTIPVDGQWGSWTTTSCSMTCGNGTIYRNRTCNNPSPSDGGKICQGVDNESSVCNLGDCPVDGHWGLWSSVRCSVTCGNGIGIRTRRCDNPAPSGGGNGCVGCDKKKKLCSLGKCHKS